MRDFKVVLFLLLLALTGSSKELTVEAGVNIKKATVELVSFNHHTFCAGVFVGKGYVLTAKHCTNKSNFYISNEGARHEVVAIIMHPEVDLALIATDSEKLGAEILKTPVAEFQEIYALGHPRGFTYVLSKGSFIKDHSRCRQVSTKLCGMYKINVYFGNSGGPIFNHLGEVISVVSAGYLMFELTMAPSQEDVVAFVERFVK